MGLFARLFSRKKLFAMQSADVTMWQAKQATGLAPGCDCLEPHYGETPFGELSLHAEEQDTQCDAWKMLEELIEVAASKRCKEFAPGFEIPPELWPQIITLPTSISKLATVKKLYLYSSHFVRIPPAIGCMTNLEELDLYTSYCLHWLPFEVTRCHKLKRSRFSTRALYGNYKFRPPFPRLGEQGSSNHVSSECSVCRRNMDPRSMRQVWISLRVGRDVLPLLVNACSNDCVNGLPKPARGYVDRPHTGGLELMQPLAGIIRP